MAKPFCFACAAAPGFKIVLGGPEGSFFKAVRVGLTPSAGLVADVSAGLASLIGGTLSAGVKADFVPSIHVTASGTQSSSSSSMSAHLDSLPFSSDCKRVAK